MTKSGNFDGVIMLFLPKKGRTPQNNFYRQIKALCGDIIPAYLKIRHLSCADANFASQTSRQMSAVTFNLMSLGMTDRSGKLIDECKSE